MTAAPAPGPEMRSHGRTSVHELLGDLIVYRNLVPCDRRLPALSELRSEIALPEAMIPRKSAPEYAQVIVHLLSLARRLDAPEATIERVIYLGDTRLNDGTAFTNICRSGGWPGLAFIGAERDGPPELDMVEDDGGALFLASRWAGLGDFVDFCQQRGFSGDQGTAVIIDLDKTTLGARGRNDHLIDRARVEAVRRTVSGLLGNSFDCGQFETAYSRLNRVEFHPFTTDNQDYLAYLCLILGSGLWSLGALVSDVRAGRLGDFRGFMAEVDRRSAELAARSPGLLPIHHQIHARVAASDPTPFKAFRHQEYRATVELMGKLADDAPVAEMLEQEIVITQEVREAVLGWRNRGALIFGLSDKPDEASLPPDDLAAQGYRPIHQTETHAVGALS